MSRNTSPVPSGGKKRDAEQWMRIVRRYMNYCFRTASVPRVDELASMLPLSREEFTRLFRAATGHSPAAIFRTIQIRRAKTLLATGDESTAHIARAAAYGSVRAFYRAFRRSTGVTPTKFRHRTRRDS